jgi:hypothetical protein
MALEAATYINDLVPSNPAATDGLSQADDHLRLLKATLQGTFPNVNGAVSASSAQLSALSGATAVQLVALAAALAAGTVRLTAPPVGRVEMYAAASAPADKLRCNGATFAFTTYPALGAYLGYASGTCTLPNFEDTGRFPRSVSAAASITLGLAQSNAFKSHTHTGTTGVENASHTHSGTTGGQSAAHTHGVSGGTSGQSNDHTHSYHDTGANFSTGGAGGGTNSVGAGNTTGGTSADHSHTFAVTSTQNSSDHTHNVSTGGPSAQHVHAFTSDATGIVAETRPEALALVFYIQT